MRTQPPLPWIAPAAPTLPATRRRIATSQLYVPSLLSHHQRRGNRRKPDCRRHPQFAFVAAFDPTGAHLLYSTLFGDYEFQVRSTVAAAIPMAPGSRWMPTATSIWSARPRPATCRPPPASFSPPALLWTPRERYVQAWRGFIAKFNPVTSAGGASLAYATYLGGQTANTGDFISGIAIDSASNAYIVGYTNSTDFPVTSGAYWTVCGPNGQTCAAAHVTKLNPSGSAILWSTFVGDAKSDGSDAVILYGPHPVGWEGERLYHGASRTGFPIGQSR